MTEVVRWTIKVSRETDLSLRTHLGAQGMKKGDLSRFVEDAVRWRILDETVQAIKDRNEDLSPEELEAEIELAVREVRAQPYAARCGWFSIPTSCCPRCSFAARRQAVFTNYGASGASSLPRVSASFTN
jgi:hypothetical protein